MEAQREIYWNIGLAGYVVYPTMLLAWIVFFFGMYRHYRLWRMGRGDIPWNNLLQGFQAHPSVWYTHSDGPP